MTKIALYTDSHDSCGEPSFMLCTAEQADAIQQHNVEALKEFEKAGFVFNKWDLRTSWIRTTPEKAHELYLAASDAQDARREAYEAAEAAKRGDMEENTYARYESWLRKDVDWLGFDENNESIWVGEALEDTPANRELFYAGLEAELEAERA